MQHDNIWYIRICFITAKQPGTSEAWIKGCDIYSECWARGLVVFCLRFVCECFVYQPVPPQPPPPPPLSRNKASKGTSKLASELGVDLGQIGGRGGNYYPVTVAWQVFSAQSNSEPSAPSNPCTAPSLKIMVGVCTRLLPRVM